MQVVQGLRDRKCKPYKYEIGDVISWGRKSKFKILNRRISKDVTRKYKYKEYYCECLNCGYKQWYRERYFQDVLKNNKPGNGCRNCGNTSKKYYIDTENTISKKAPWMISLLKDKSDADRLSPKTNKKTYFICPQCGGEVYTSPNLVSNAGRLVCPQCADYFSIPNKFGLSLFRQAKVDRLKNEYSPEWAGLRKYDFSFWKDGIHYIVEFDGGFHFNTAFGETPKSKQIIDMQKQKLAEEHGCKVIRILSLESKVSYLRKQVEESELANIIDLSKIDWKQVQKDCIDSVTVKACKLYMSGKSVKEVAKELYISIGTATRDLEIGREIGICDYKTKYEIYHENFEKMVKIKNEHPEYTTKEMCEILGVSIEVYHQMRWKAIAQNRLDDTRTDREKKRDEIIDFIERNPNHTHKYYCEQFNVCYSTIQHCFEIMEEQEKKDA